MPNYYLDLPYISAIPGAYRADSSELMAVSGANIGNLAFRHALRSILLNVDDYRPVRYLSYVEAANRGEVDRTIVSCANWLGTSEQDEAANLNRARAFEAVDVPTVCFGLGVQAPASSGVPELGPNTRRLAKVLSERAELLSVRDEMTRRALDQIGISNVVVTGCPSNFINPDPELGITIIEKARMLREDGLGWKDIRSALSEFSGGHTRSALVLRESLRLMAEAPAFLVVQSPMLLPFLLGESREPPRVYIGNNPYRPDQNRLRRLLLSSTLHFSSIGSWMDFARTCDVSFGMRIHGTMIPLQAGVPAVLVSHDSRTTGLAEHMGIPQISADDFDQVYQIGPSGLLTEVVQQMEGYDSRRAALAKIMCDYLESNGLAANPALRQIANAHH